MIIYNEDKTVNSDNTKGLFIVSIFRIVHYFIVSNNRLFSFFGRILNIFYKLITEYLIGMKLPSSLKVGKGLCVFHGIGLIIHESTIIGEFVTLRNSTTIGSKNNKTGAPILGNNINVGSNCVIIGNIKIGDNVTIGAGTIITKDIPSNCTVVGNPARIIK